MKKFKDLQVGDSIIVGFEKKTITKIISDNDDSDEGIEIYISEDEFYYVFAFLSIDYCCDAAEWIFAGKDAIIEYYTQKLRDLQIEYETDKFLCERSLEKAKTLK